MPKVPGDILRDQMLRAAATPDIIALARTLQCAAFLDQPERGFILNRTFDPAPVYMKQAWAIYRDTAIRANVHFYVEVFERKRS